MSYYCECIHFITAILFCYSSTWNKILGWLVGWLCLMSHRQRGHLETAHPFTVPCEGREAQ